jgi:hypothetical protein
MKLSCLKIILPKSRPHRIRPLSSDFRLLAAVLCLLSAVLCPFARAGGSWLVDGQAVQTLEVSTATDPRVVTAVQPSATNEHLTIFRYADDPQQDHKKITIRAAAPGVGDVSAVVNPEEGFVVYSGGETVARLSASSMRLGTVDTEIEILGSDVYLYADASDPDHALNRRTGDNRYIKRTEGITVNHTIQAGAVLQIQNGIITAINP